MTVSVLLHCVSEGRVAEGRAMTDPGQDTRAAKDRQPRVGWCPLKVFQRMFQGILLFIHEIIGTKDVRSKEAQILIREAFQKKPGYFMTTC